jgi:hypothetical protein
MVESMSHGTFIQSSLEDPLEACIAHFGGTLDIEKSIEEVNTLLGTLLLFFANKWQPKVVSLPLSSSPPLPSTVEPPKLELIPLPNTLKYMFLDSSKTLPVIIYSFRFRGHARTSIG